MIAFFGTKIQIILNNTKDTHKSTYDAKRLRNYSLYNQTPKEKQRGVKDSRRRPQVQGPPNNRTPVIYHAPYSMHAVPFWGSIRIVKKVPSSEISLK